MVVVVVFLAGGASLALRVLLPSFVFVFLPLSRNLHGHTLRVSAPLFSAFLPFSHFLLPFLSLGPYILIAQAFTPLSRRYTSLSSPVA